MIEILKQVMLFQSLKPQSLTLINPRVNKQSDIIEIKLPYQSNYHTNQFWLKL